MLPFVRRLMPHKRWLPLPEERHARRYPCRLRDTCHPASAENATPIAPMIDQRSARAAASNEPPVVVYGMPALIFIASTAQCVIMKYETQLAAAPVPAPPTKISCGMRMIGTRLCARSAFENDAEIKRPSPNAANEARLSVSHNSRKPAVNTPDPDTRAFSATIASSAVV